MKLSKEDAAHLSAAEGWLDLGNWREANEELERIAPEHRVHPNVLETRCRVAEMAKAGEMVLTVSQVLTEQLPKRLPGWLHRTGALHKLGKTHEAYHLLVEVVEVFPDNQSIRYEIACYAAQRGLIAEAVEWLKIVFATDTDGEFRKNALDEPALEEVWKKIGEL